ncbi:hypothetical protein K474DRAFT_768361 [Panus rudis PR-1116 ss-1]|nr:hypothetical protein K474DRAFT_768361 [Panus rudis PR-1116 ss-1]
MFISVFSLISSLVLFVRSCEDDCQCNVYSAYTFRVCIVVHIIAYDDVYSNYPPSLAIDFTLVRICSVIPP